ncbi:MAG: M56 family metallopeptidase [Lachnospiraceae bacterium]|nr:M56 family metallopeptidase [Lachnospiraceae bacterium]
MQGDFLSKFFISLLNISMVGCYTIVVVMVLRALLLRWERKYVYLLWFVVFVNLCIPFRLEGPFSLVPAWIAEFDIAGRNESRSEGKTDYLPNEQIVVTETIGSVHHYYTSAEEDSVTDLNGVPGTDLNSETTYIKGESEGKTDFIPNEQIVETVSISSHNEIPAVEGGIPGTDINHEVTYHDYYTNDGRGKNARKSILVLVWGIGVILLAAGNIRAVWKLQGKLKNAEPFSGDGSIDEHADRNIRTVDGIESPFLWGVFSPVIYLPRSMDAREHMYIIAHENYHRKRKDYIFKPLFFTITVIHWFNPLVWAAYLLFVRDMEISCDEAVIANADEDIRKKYAESLLKYAARQNGYTLTPITFGEPSLKCRIKNVLQYKERNEMISILILCVVIVVMAGLFFDPQQGKLMMLPSGLENVQITQGISDPLAADYVDKGAVDSDMKDLAGKKKFVSRARKIRRSRLLSDWAKVQGIDTRQKRRMSA